MIIRPLAAAWTDNFITTQRTAFVEVSPLARLEFVTTARRLWVRAYDTGFGTYATFNLAVRVNGAHYATLTSTALGYNYFAVDLADGGYLKRVEIVGSSVINTVGDKAGLWVDCVRLVGGSIISNYAIDADIAVIGDSIACGSYATVPGRDGWVSGLRNSTGRACAVYGFGGWDLYDNGLDGAARQVIADALTGYRTIALSFGTNDYGFQPWTAAAFGAAYGDLLDRIRATVPVAAIIAMTPIVRLNEDTPNSRGNTLEDYRSAIRSAAATRAWCAVLEGATLVTLADLVDGIHPGDAGHAKLAAAVQAVV